MLTQEHSSSLMHSQHLQAELLTVCQQRDQAEAEATKWRRRYEVEAQQRRQDVENADAIIQELRAETQQLFKPVGTSFPALNPSRDCNSVKLDGPAPRTQNKLQILLSQVLAERDQLAQVLAEERASHAKVRENLMTMLRDALKTRSQTQARELSLPSSRHGARAGSIIGKDRATCLTDLSTLNPV